MTTADPTRSDRGRADLETLDLETAPPHLYGRFRRDPVMRVVGAAFSHLYPRVVRRLHVAADHAVNTGVTQVRLVDRTVVAEDENVVALRFEAPDGGQLPPWYAGAHLDLLLPSGRMREYSLCGDPTDRTYYRIAVRRIPDGGGGSVEVHDDLRVGDTLSVKGPRNAFPLAVPGLGSRAEHLRFVAGGIGITPILPMIQLADRLDLDWSMVYTGRSRDSLPFVDEVLTHGDRVTVRTDDDGGLPTADELIGPDISPRTAVYSCGPIPMLDALVARLRDVRDVELHHERFAPPPVVDGHPFTVTLASTGTTVPVGADETTLAALRRERPSVPYSCRQGFCGTCRTRVLDGAVDHRDTLLTTAERDAGWMLSCVSRAAGDSLTVDI